MNHSSIILNTKFWIASEGISIIDQNNIHFECNDVNLKRFVMMSRAGIYSRLNSLLIVFFIVFFLDSENTIINHYFWLLAIILILLIVSIIIRFMFNYTYNGKSSFNGLSFSTEGSYKYIETNNEILVLANQNDDLSSFLKELNSPSLTWHHGNMLDLFVSTWFIYLSGMLVIFTGQYPINLSYLLYASILFILFIIGSLLILRIKSNKTARTNKFIISSILRRLNINKDC